MTNAKRGRGSRHGFYFCAVAALGFALSGCGGGGSGAVGSASTSQASTSSVGSATGLGSNPPTATTGVTVNWQPPTENTDGTALTNLAGYDIHYGTSSGNYTQSITVSNPGVATYVVDNLSPGKYYFAVAAINSSGTESPLSSEVTATVTDHWHDLCNNLLALLLTRSAGKNHAFCTRQVRANAEIAKTAAGLF